MNVTILSAFRNATGYIERYFTQIDSLASLLAKRGDTLQLVLGYGDSYDGTGEQLYEAASHRLVETVLLEVDHGGPPYGSIEHPQRFKQLAYVGNELLGCVLPSADVVAIVESDLLWEAETLLQLIDDLRHVPPLSAVAPMVMDGPESFYDVFAFRKEGLRFTKVPPYWPPRKRWLMSDHLMQLESAGSVLFMTGELARKVKFSDEQAIVGLCEQIYQYGGSIWLDPQASVQHP